MADHPRRPKSLTERETEIRIAGSGGVREGDMQNAIAQMQAQAETVAETTLHAVRLLAHCVADNMQKAHGGNWRIQIDHEHGLVIIARRQDREIEQPKRGEAV